MSILDFKSEVSDEVETILSSDFSVEVASTKSVPHFGDSAITFPNLDSLQQGCKVIETCVLYIDIRRSTTLNMTHKPRTVAKLYSAFVRAMTRCAERTGGHVRGIIGDRVMVIFDAENCFENAIETAILMNSVSSYVVNKHFNRDEVTCGIGLDYGKMLATKTGVRRHGHEQQNYRSLVWLGRPANVASKLTDLANKEEFSIDWPVVHAGYEYPQQSEWYWQTEQLGEFISHFKKDYSTGQWRHQHPFFADFFVSHDSVVLKPRTPAILMTKIVYDGFRKAKPNAESITKNLFGKVNISVPGYTGDIVGGNVIKTVFRP